MAARTRLGLWGHGTGLAGSFAGKGSGSHPVDRITRLGAWGHGTRRTGSFAGKASGGTHPVGEITRLGAAGYNTRRCGSFAGKTPSSGATHPVGRITRLGAWGHNTQRTGSFAGKTPSAVAEDHRSRRHPRLRLQRDFAPPAPFLDIVDDLLPARRRDPREEAEITTILSVLYREGYI